MGHGWSRAVASLRFLSCGQAQGLTTVPLLVPSSSAFSPLPSGPSDVCSVMSKAVDGAEQEERGEGISAVFHSQVRLPTLKLMIRF